MKQGGMGNYGKFFSFFLRGYYHLSCMYAHNKFVLKKNVIKLFMDTKIFTQNSFPNSAKLRLNYENKAKNMDEEDEDIQEKLKQLKDLNLKANWSEAVFEGKYQSLLQLIIILEDASQFHKFLGTSTIFSFILDVRYLITEL